MPAGGERRVRTAPSSRVSRLCEVMDLMLDSVGDPLALEIAGRLGQLFLLPLRPHLPRADRLFRRRIPAKAPPAPRRPPAAPRAGRADRAHRPGLRLPVQRRLRQGLQAAVRHVGQGLARGGWRSYMDQQVGRESDVSFFVAEPDNLDVILAPYIAPAAGQHRRAHPRARPARRVAALPALFRPVRRRPVDRLQRLHRRPRTARRRARPARPFTACSTKTPVLRANGNTVMTSAWPGSTWPIPTWACACCRPATTPSSTSTASGPASAPCTKTGWSKQALWRLDSTRPHIQKVERDGAGQLAWLARAARQETLAGCSALSKRMQRDRISTGSAATSTHRKKWR